MTRSKFEEALEEVFEDRAAEFSPDSRQLLEKLWNQGQQAGRELERHDTHQHIFEKAVRSECGNYLCVPVPKEMLVLEGASAGMDRLEHEIRTRQREMNSRRATSPMSQMLASMDAEILERLASHARATEGLQQTVLEGVSGLLTLGGQAGRQHTATLPWTGVDEVMVSPPVKWQREILGTFSSHAPRPFRSYGSSPSSSTRDELKRCVTDIPPDGESGKR